MTVKDLKKVLILLILILTVSYGVDKLIYLILNQLSNKVFSGQTIGKLNHFFSIKDSVDVLIFGSSRANHHIDIDLVSDNGFNMGLDGRNIAYISTIIKTLSDKQQTIIINIEPSYIFNEDYNGTDIKALYVMYHKNEIIKSEIDRLNQSNPLQKLYWCIDYNNKVLGLIRNYLRPKYNYKTYNGYDPLILNESQKEIRNKIINNNIKKAISNHNINQLSLYYFREIRDFCEKNSKQLIMITTPIYEHNNYSDSKRISDVMSNLNITYWDYTNFFDDNNSIEYWKDRTHLSKQGAELFSAILAEDLILYFKKNN